jgi:hypothetical protein
MRSIKAAYGKLATSRVLSKPTRTRVRLAMQAGIQYDLEKSRIKSGDFENPIAE